MRILIAGGSGFVGSRIVKRFSKTHDFINISLSKPSPQAANNLQLDLTKPMDFLNLDKKIDLIINAVECHPSLFENDKDVRKAYLEVTKNLIDYAKRTGVKKIIQFSISNIETVENDYHLSKFVSEGLIERSGLDYVILKPSVIFGDTSPLDLIVESILSRKIMPRFWNKDIKLSPVHIKDVLDNLAFVLENQTNEVWDKSYALCGPNSFTFEEILLKRASKRPQFVKAPAIAGKFFVQTALKDAPPKHLRILLEWVKSDGFSLKMSPLTPQISY